MLRPPATCMENVNRKVCVETTIRNRRYKGNDKNLAEIHVMRLQCLMCSFYEAGYLVITKTVHCWQLIFA